MLAFLTFTRKFNERQWRQHHDIKKQQVQLIQQVQHLRMWQA